MPIPNQVREKAGRPMFTTLAVDNGGDRGEDKAGARQAAPAVGLELDESKA